MKSPHPSHKMDEPHTAPLTVEPGGVLGGPPFVEGKSGWFTVQNCVYCDHRMIPKESHIDPELLEPCDSAPFPKKILTKKTEEKMFPVQSYDSHCETYIVFAVAHTQEAAQKAADAKMEKLVAEEIEQSVDAEDEAETWREELVEKGVPANVVETLTPPESLVEEAKKLVTTRVKHRWTVRVLSPIPVVE